MSSKLKLAGFFLSHPLKSIANLKLSKISQLVRALRNEPPELVYQNVKNHFLYKQNSVFNSAKSNNCKVQELEAKYPGITAPVGIANAYALESKFHPIPSIIEENATVRVNVLLPQLDPSIMFGGYISCFQFIAALVSAGNKVRILICESPEFDQTAVLAKLANDEYLHNALSQCEYENVTSKSNKLVISKDDSFIAYSFWTGILAHKLAKTIDKKFIFFIQEYEPIFHSQDSFHAIGDYVYSLPHYAIFNTVILRDFFKQSRIGVFEDSEQQGLDNSCFFQHALTKTLVPTLEELNSRSKKRFLFYGRPENHAKRNLFEIALIGLKTAVFNGVFDEGEWEFVGVGTLGTEHEIELGHGHILKLISKMSHADYAKALSGFDVGLSLMYAPHPSILPFEMSSSGIVTVTNTYGGRDEKLLKSISGNLVPCKSNIDSLAQALKMAVSQMEDKEQRIKHANIDWVNDWQDSFNKNVMAEINNFL